MDVALYATSFNPFGLHVPDRHQQQLFRRYRSYSSPYCSFSHTSSLRGAMMNTRMDPQSYTSRLGDYKVLIGIHGEHVGYGAIRPTDEDVRGRG